MGHGNNDFNPLKFLLDHYRKRTPYIPSYEDVQNGKVDWDAFEKESDKHFDEVSNTVSAVSEHPTKIAYVSPAVFSEDVTGFSDREYLEAEHKTWQQTGMEVYSDAAISSYYNVLSDTENDHERFLSSPATKFLLAPGNALATAAGAAGVSGATTALLPSLANSNPTSVKLLKIAFENRKKTFEFEKRNMGAKLVAGLFVMSLVVYSYLKLVNIRVREQNAANAKYRFRKGIDEEATKERFEAWLKNYYAEEDEDDE